MSLREIAEEASTWLWGQLEEGLALDSILHEVACTDFFLKEIAFHGSTNLVTATVTKEDEIGADWEWWFMDQGGRSLPVRVQAKVMWMRSTPRYNPADSPFYKQFGHIIGKGTKKQVDVLIDRARRDRMFPVYCLYTHFNDNFLAKSPEPTSKCKYIRLDKSCFGVSVIGAENVRLTTSKKLSDIFKAVHALPCLFERFSSLESLQSYLIGRWRQTALSIGFGPTSDAENGPPTLIRSLEEAPDYVRALRERIIERSANSIGSEADAFDNDPISDNQEASDPLALLLREGTGRVTLFLLNDQPAEEMIYSLRYRPRR